MGVLIIVVVFVAIGEFELLIGALIMLLLLSSWLLMSLNCWLLF